MILECHLDGESVEIITRAYGNVQVGIEHVVLRYDTGCLARSEKVTGRQINLLHGYLSRE